MKFGLGSDAPTTNQLCFPKRLPPQKKNTLLFDLAVPLLKPYPTEASKGRESHAPEDTHGSGVDPSAE